MKSAKTIARQLLKALKNELRNGHDDAIVYDSNGHHMCITWDGRALFVNELDLEDMTKSITDYSIEVEGELYNMFDTDEDGNIKNLNN